jgi:hypothetical protein
MSFRQKLLSYREVAKRVSGFSTPIFGIQWEPTESERNVIRTLLTFLEDRRVLYLPNYLEILSQVEESVVRIREELTKTLQALPEKSEAVGPIRTMRSACRKYLTEPYTEFPNLPEGRMHHMERHRYQKHEATPGYFLALGELRSVFGVNIAMLSSSYGIDLEEDIAGILPPMDSDD